MKALFLPGIINTLCKQEEVPLFDVDEVLPMDSHIQPLLV